MKKIAFLSAAEDEMIQSALFYESQTNGHGAAKPQPNLEIRISKSETIKP